MKFNLNIKKINYIKILYKDASDFWHCLKASVKSISKNDIYACVKQDEWTKIPAPQEIIINFICDEGLYRTNTTLKYTNYEEPYLYLTVKLPEKMEYQQNREYFRVRLRKDVTVVYTAEEKVERLNTYTYDISANGLSVILPNKIDFPEEVFLDINFENKEIRTKAKFIRTDSEDDFVKASFKFKDLTVHDMDYISQACIQKQIADKRTFLE